MPNPLTALPLSKANIGIAVSDGAAIAREIADITIIADSLYELVSLGMIAQKLMKRIRSNYRFAIGFNYPAGMLSILRFGLRPDPD